MNCNLIKETQGTDEYYHYLDPLERKVTLIKQGGRLDRLVFSLFKEPHFLTPDSLKIAVLGDLHGHLTLALQKLKEWCTFSGQTIDAILQVGDIGAMDDATVCDKVTKEMQAKDPQERGFLDYLHPSEVGDTFFGKKGYFRNIPFYFIDGNHDDIRVLASLRDGSASGLYPQLHYLGDGSEATISNSRHGITVTGLGWYNQSAILPKIKNQPLGILLSHTNGIFDYHSWELRADLSKECSYRYRFFGHHRDAPQQSDPARNSYGLSDVKLKKSKLASGSIGLLHYAGEQSYFFYLPPFSRLE